MSKNKRLIIFEFVNWKWWQISLFVCMIIVFIRTDLETINHIIRYILNKF